MGLNLKDLHFLKLCHYNESQFNYYDVFIPILYLQYYQ